MNSTYIYTRFLLKLTNCCALKNRVSAVSPLISLLAVALFRREASGMNVLRFRDCPPLHHLFCHIVAQCIQMSRVPERCKAIFPHFYSKCCLILADTVELPFFYWHAAPYRLITLTGVSAYRSVNAKRSCQEGAAGAISPSLFRILRYRTWNASTSTTQMQKVPKPLWYNGLGTSVQLNIG